MKPDMPIQPTNAPCPLANPLPRVRRSGPSWHATLAALAAAAVLVAGCGTSPPTRFYTVDPVMPTAHTAAAATPAADAVPRFRLRAVRLPPAWDRAELIQEVGPGQVRVSEFELWVAPLGRSTQQALLQDLAARLPAGAVLLSQAGPAGGMAVAELSVDILSLRVGGKTATMLGSWSVRQAPTDAWRSPPPVSLEVPLSGDDGAATALAISRLLGQLADRIAADLGAGSSPG